MHIQSAVLQAVWPENIFIHSGKAETVETEEQLKRWRCQRVRIKSLKMLLSKLKIDNWDIKKHNTFCIYMYIVWICIISTYTKPLTLEKFADTPCWPIVEISKHSTSAFIWIVCTAFSFVGDYVYLWIINSKTVALLEMLWVVPQYIFKVTAWGLVLITF